MSSFNRRSVLCVPLALAACGFSPVYGPSGTGSALQNQILVNEPVNEDTFFLNRRIEDRLGRNETPSYLLNVSLSVNRESLARNSSNNINRFNFIGVADYSLVDEATGNVVTSGRVDNFTGASASGTTVATLAAERDARRRLMTLLADQIVERLLVTDLA
ncbi:MAG: LPS assembly lipoprotein LptE [Pseudomonadota bacterium]